jgi:hypothetical protein
MVLKRGQIEAIRDFFDGEFTTEEWFILHTDIKFDDMTHTMTISIDNINEQEYGWLKGE